MDEIKGAFIALFWFIILVGVVGGIAIKSCYDRASNALSSDTTIQQTAHSDDGGHVEAVQPTTTANTSVPMNVAKTTTSHRSGHTHHRHVVNDIHDNNSETPTVSPSTDNNTTQPSTEDINNLP